MGQRWPCLLGKGRGHRRAEELPLTLAWLARAHPAVQRRSSVARCRGLHLGEAWPLRLEPPGPALSVGT